MNKLILWCIFAPYIAFAQYEDRSITVYGNAEQDLAPDEVLMRVTFTEYEKIKNSEIEQKENQFKLMLTKWKIPQEHVEVVEFNSYKYGNKVRIVKVYQVKLTDPKIANTLIIDLYTTGAKAVHIADVKYNNRDSIQLEVTRLAIENARKKAAMMVTSQGDQLGNTLSIKEFGAERLESEYDSYTYASTFEYRARLNATGAVSRAVSSGPDEFAVEKVKINSKVRVTYQLE